MRHAESVIFGGSGLDRAVELRADPEQVESLFQTGETIVLWRGKPLFDYETSTLVRLSSNHELLREAQSKPTLLGMEGARAIFAVDVSHWQDPNIDLDALGQFNDPSQNRYPGFPPTLVFTELRGIMAKLTPRDAELAATARSLFIWHRSHRYCSKCGARSERTQAGWQRDCPACKTSHFPRTDPVVIVLATKGNSVLLGRSHGWPEGMFSLLAGFMEPGETMEAAARREVFEESGICLGSVTYLSSQPWAFPSSLMMGCHAEALTLDITIDPKEMDDVRWFTREAVLAATVDEDSPLKPARKGSIAHFLIHNWLSDTLT